MLEVKSDFLLSQHQHPDFMVKERRNGDLIIAIIINHILLFPPKIHVTFLSSSCLGLSLKSV